ncbi:MAG: sulfate ABC transporter permease subunit CysW, partial [Rhodoferax sp.]|nr:sulfate ABC transporter permease subunit CysW [Rhodoferax sp.]
TNTIPLHVEILYNEYQSVAAFAVASLLALLALVTLVIKQVVEWRSRREQQAAATLSPEPRLLSPRPPEPLPIQRVTP